MANLLDGINLGIPQASPAGSCPMEAISTFPLLLAGVKRLKQWQDVLKECQSKIDNLKGVYGDLYGLESNTMCTGPQYTGI